MVLGGDMQFLARALGGEVVSGAISVPGPGHSKGDRSLRVFLDPAAVGGIRVYSHANDDWRACLDYVKARLGIEREWRPTPQQAWEKPIQKPEVDDKARTGRAMSIWAEARPLPGTTAHVYLAQRGINVDALDLHHGLRWHPSCPWEMGRHGCMVALFTDVITNEPKAIHRTAVTPAGAKVDKKMLGSSKGCCIRLSPDDAVAEGLHITEGIENGLTALSAAIAPVWACGSAGAIASFPVLQGVECLTVYADNDETGLAAAHKCRASWDAARRECIIYKAPGAGQDLNDIAVLS